ncbi:hypothetical protein INT48_007371 [Thamnidium elegans]|uniref:Uncharacterized protein n=1 Tax=Thamnidium elegans TaxID=101142 RepID=A0A8H7VRT5_9FUNG|nr:hypothetical protein INT48_007371 [Thamnidium elegans]
MVRHLKRQFKVLCIAQTPLCVSVISKRAIQSRDSLSALAIGLVGLSTVLFGIPFPEFLNNKISENYAEDYIKKTSSFKLQKKTGNHEVIQKIRKIKHNIKKRGLIMFN